MKSQRVKSIVFILLLAFSFKGFSQTLKFDGVSEIKRIKRGKKYSITWSGGLRDQTAKIELHNVSGKVKSWDQILNDGEHTIRLNSRLKPRKNYNFKIFVAEEEVSSQNIQIKRRIPLALTISTVVFVPALMILLSPRHVPPDSPIP